MLTMTYGEMPKYAVFRARFERAVPSGDYPIRLSASDAATASRAGLDGSDGLYLDDDHDALSLWRAVTALAFEWEMYGDEGCGSLASSIFSTLGIEWI